MEKEGLLIISSKKGFGDRCNYEYIYLNPFDDGI